MRILLLSPQPISPLEDGLNLRVHHLFRELVSRHSIWLLYLNEDGLNIESQSPMSLPFVATQAIPIQQANGRPFRHCQDYSLEAERVIDAFLQTIPVDVIVGLSIYMVPYVQKFNNWPVVVDLVDSMSLLIYRDWKKESRLHQSLQLLRKWWWFRSYEKREFRQLQDFVVVSDVDAEVVRSRAPGTNVRVIPNGVDIDYFRPSPLESESLEIVFSGVMGFPPNKTAAIYFYSKILPLIRKVFPDVRFTIVGKSPSEELYRLACEDPLVTITGYVPDIRPYLNRASVYVAPMVSGGGIKNKILEASAMARPVVATPIACGGLQMFTGETLFVAEDPKTFADAVIRLLRDRTLRQQLGKQAREYVVKHYTWGQQAQHMEDLLEGVIEKSKASHIWAKGNPDVLIDERN